MSGSITPDVLLLGNAHNAYLLSRDVVSISQYIGEDTTESDVQNMVPTWNSRHDDSLRKVLSR